MDLTKYKDVGDLLLPKRVKDFLETYLIGSDKSIFYISIWSIIHFISGLITGYFLLNYTYYNRTESFIVGFIVHTIWELWQYLITNTPRNLRGLVDTIIDTILYMIGIFIIR